MTALICPKCAAIVKPYLNPTPTVDIIIRLKSERREESIILIKRKNPPFGWAIPGGFVDYGESLEEAAIREAWEETSLRVVLIRQFHTYSDPMRDPRQHNISTVFIATADGKPEARDDAAETGLFTHQSLPAPLVFDHAQILDDYFSNRY